MFWRNLSCQLHLHQLKWQLEPGCKAAKAKPWGKTLRYSSWPPCWPETLPAACQRPHSWSRALWHYFFCTLKGAQHVGPLGLIQGCISASLPFQKCRITCQGSIGSQCCQRSQSHSNKGCCLLTHRLSLNETGAICRFINYTLSHTTSLSLEQREGERGLPFLLYINVRLQPSWLQLTSLVLSLLPSRYAINYNKRNGGNSDIHITEYSLTLNFVQKPWPWNQRKQHWLVMIVTRLILSWWFHIWFGEGRSDVPLNVHFFQTAQRSAAISSEGDAGLDSSSRCCLALMTDWKICSCLSLNVILLPYIRPSRQ